MSDDYSEHLEKRIKEMRERMAKSKLKGTKKRKYWIVELNGECIMKECNFKSEVKHLEEFGCNWASNNVVCCGEEKCILYQISKNTGINKTSTSPTCLTASSSSKWPRSPRWQKMISSMLNR